MLQKLLAAALVLVVSLGLAGLLAKLLYDSNPVDYSQAFVFGVFIVVALLLLFIGYKLSQRWLQ